MDEPTVSVIIPVYKTEPYLEECVDSVLRQEYPRLEIVLVDDGSPDNCPALCDRYAARYGHIRVVHQANRGLGHARNAGMAASSGKYVFFVDSDDCLDGPDAIGLLVAQAERTKADITVGGFRRLHGSTISGIKRHYLQNGERTDTVDFRFRGFIMYGHLAYDWGKLYRRGFLEEHGLECQPYPYTQDKAHNMMCCACRPVYAFIDESVCLYRVNEESVTFRYKDDFIRVWTSIASDFHKFLDERGIDEDAYGDLPAFHIVIGSVFLAKQEARFKTRAVAEAAKALREYNADLFVRGAMKALARGKYVSEVEALSWKVMIRAAAILCSLRLYWLYAAGVVLLLKLDVDGQISRSRYRGRNARDFI